MPYLAVSQETAADGSTVISLSGELDFGGAAALGEAFADAADGDCPWVVLDCADLTFVDSTGLRTILGAVRALARRGGGLVIACRNPTVLRLFALTGIDNVVPVAATLGQALARLGDPGAGPPAAD